MSRQKKPSVPSPRFETVRKEIVSLLEREACTAKDISGEIGIPEKEVYEHLEHIRRSLEGTARQFLITPAVCRKCGFQFSKRHRLKRPGKCPACRGESISAPAFGIGQDR
ncbi:MAG: transcriptional regulator [Nitrospirae bacterium GWD2_57_9]|nr:MAG: transcriptional regulator [Nitrospirae bacterium GWD2_57_9]